MCGLEINRYTDLDESGEQNRLRPLPRRIRVALRENRARVEQVEDINPGTDAPVAEANNLRNPQIELIPPSAVHRSRLHQRNRHACGATREGPPKGWGDDGIRRDEIRQDLWPRLIPNAALN